MRTHIFILFATLFPFFLFGQKIDVEQLKGMEIRNIGPAGMSGRVTAIDVVLSNPSTIYIGTASGGVWRSTSGGIDWEPIADDMPLASIGALKINQKNPDEIWVGTGEGNPRNSQNSGQGLYKTIDGGKTWKLVGLENSRTIHRILIHREDPRTVFVGVTGSAWGPNEDRGIFKTTDGGKSWEKILYISDETGCADLVADPVNPNKLIAAMWEYGRKPWTFNSGGPSSGIYVSYDGGETWERRTDEDGLPKGDLGRIGLAIAPSAPNVVYALVEAKENALYKSTDGGFEWKKMASANEPDNEVGNRPFYYSEIYVDPQNENRVYSIWSVLSKSEDGGKTFGQWVGWKVHPDHHAMWISPDDPDFIIEGNDGGLNISHDRGTTWRFVENLPLAQFYHINYDMEIPYRVMGGMQDNGSWIGPSQVWKAGGIRNSDWREINFGDGFDVMVRPDDSRYAYAMWQGGNVSYIDTETGHKKNIKPVHPKGGQLRFNWNAGIAQNPFHDCGIYFGSQFLHKSMDCGESWEIISPDLTTNDTSKQKQDISGGLTIDATNAENYTTIVSIAPSPVDEKVIWVGTDDGNLQLTRDGGKTWDNLSRRLLGANPGSWIPSIEVSKKKAGEAFVVVSDYRRNDWRPFVYHTTDYGVTFSRIVDERQVSGHALSIVQDPEVAELLWLGTDYGLYFSIDYGKNWSKWTNGYPSVSTYDLKIHPREHDLIVGTFGRAAWILDDIRPIREMARTNGKVLEKEFSLFPSPDAYLAEYRSVDGTRFVGDAHFSGQNRRSGAMMTAWVKPEMEKKEKREKKKGENSENDKEKRSDKKDEKAKVVVLDMEGDTVRNFSTKLDTGMVRFRWNLRANGVHYPSRKKPKADADLPNGQQVLPGKYKVVVNYQGNLDSTEVTVHADPRLNRTLAEMKAEYETFDLYFSTIEKATAGFNQILDAKKTIKRVNGALVNLPDSTQTEIKDLGKALADSLNQLEKRYMMPEGLKGIQRNPNNLMGLIWKTSSYIGSSDGSPSKSAQIMMDKVTHEISNVLSDLNQLMSNDFKAYQEKVEGLEFSLFEKYEPIKME